jgi:putative membrane protein
VSHDDRQAQPQSDTLRLHLRRQRELDDLAGLLAPDELAAIAASDNRPLAIMQWQGARIYDGVADGTPQGFDSFQPEGALAQLAGQQAVCERIRDMPLPRQYDYFTRIFLSVFILFLPLCLVGPLAEIGITWATVPISTVIAFVFATISKVGLVLECPFESQSDIPMTAICRTIERDLRFLLGEHDLPPELGPVDGYLR